MKISKNTAICFLCGKILPTQISEVLKNSKVGLLNPVEAFQNALIEGLSHFFEKLDIISLPFIGSYPLNYKSLWSPDYREEKILKPNGHTITWKNIKFNNVLFFKYYFRYFSAKNALKEYCEDNKLKDKIIIIIYGVQINFIKAALKLKKIYKNLRICVIVPDLPDYKIGEVQKWKKWILNYDTHVPFGLYESIDGYILLTTEMKEKVCLSNQPWVLIEGIYNVLSDDTDRPSEIAQSYELSRYTTVLYSGSLAKEYNIIGLVDAFSKTNDPRARLLLCGNGSAVPYILEKIKEDKRIIYLGKIDREEVLRLQREVKFLINPRTPDGEYTKYSFPSKTMEYLASGTPTILYKLSGIPEEYYKYCIPLEKSDIDKLTILLENLFKSKYDEYINLGHRAREYIIKNKNPYVQCKKIQDLIRNL